MPVYAYKCDNCGYYFEEKQSFSDDPITDCPNCGHQQTVHRVIQPVGVVFKGSGFYVTDNRGSKSSTAPASSSGNGDTGSSGASEGKSDGGSSDAKSEPKAEKNETSAKPEKNTKNSGSSDSK